MIRNLFVTLSLSLLVTGVVACGGDSSNSGGKNDLSVTTDDLSTGGNTGDMATITGAALGGACTKTADCGTGLVCQKTAGLFPNGYCTKTCNPSNDQCSQDGSSACVGLGSNMNFCLLTCGDATTCRTGYSCYVPNFIGIVPGGCLGTISNLLDCDPTANNGLCTTASGTDAGNVTGGCLRAAYGTGNKGSCTPLCEIGQNTCAPVNMTAEACMISFSDTQDFTGDLFNGPVCSQIGLATPITDGQQCQDGGNYYINICASGLGCDLSTPGTNGSSGDKACHPLCALPGYSAAGIPTNGGTIAPACGSGKTCKDVFGFSAASNAAEKVGLCE